MGYLVFKHLERTFFYRDNDVAKTSGDLWSQVFFLFILFFFLRNFDFLENCVSVAAQSKGCLFSRKWCIMFIKEGRRNCLPCGIIQFKELPHTWK